MIWNTQSVGMWNSSQIPVKTSPSNSWANLQKTTKKKHQLKHVDYVQWNNETAQEHTTPVFSSPPGQNAPMLSGRPAHSRTFFFSVWTLSERLSIAGTWHQMGSSGSKQMNVYLWNSFLALSVCVTLVVVTSHLTLSAACTPVGAPGSAGVHIHTHGTHRVEGQSLHSENWSLPCSGPFWGPAPHPPRPPPFFQCLVFLNVELGLNTSCLWVQLLMLSLISSSSVLSF